MLGVEMMLSNMIGMKPDEIKTAVADTMKAVQAAANDMADIKNRLISIEEKLTEKEQLNERGECNSNGGSTVQL